MSDDKEMIWIMRGDEARQMDAKTFAMSSLALKGWRLCTDEECAAREAALVATEAQKEAAALPDQIREAYRESMLLEYIRDHGGKLQDGELEAAGKKLVELIARFQEIGTEQMKPMEPIK